MSTFFIDSHVHLDFKEFSEDLPLVLARAVDCGVTRFISIGAGEGLNSAERVTKLAAAHANIWATVGVHPHDAKLGCDITKLTQLAKSPKVVAIGETGLDFYRDWSPREDQERVFRAHIRLALELSLPLIIHSREAGNECLTILEELGASSVGGVFHCYAEDAVFAEKLRAIYFLVSFPGSVTFKKAQTLREMVKNIALEQIMVETDAPYLAPEPYRGKRCESSFMLETAKKIAELKQISLAEFASVVTATTERFFKLPQV